MFFLNSDPLTDNFTDPNTTTMNNDLLIYKSAFRITLHPMFELLVYKKSKLAHDEWMNFVEMTRKSIIANPEQFLGKEFPGMLLTGQIVDEIFAEFWDEHEMAV